MGKENFMVRPLPFRRQIFRVLTPFYQSGIVLQKKEALMKKCDQIFVTIQLARVYPISLKKIDYATLRRR